MKRIAIMQPTYLPWLGYFHLISQVDCFIIYDHAQFERSSWQNRNRIRDKNGIQLLSVPVQHKGKLGQPIRDVKIDPLKNDLAKHLKSISLSYKKAPFFNEYFEQTESIYNKKHEYLIDLNMDFILLGQRIFNLDAEIKFSSEMDVEGMRVEALIDMCQKTNADQYLSPVGSKAYIDENNLFPQYGIDLIYQDFTHPVYEQIHSSEFISHLAFLDYIYNTGNVNFFSKK